MPGKGFKSLLQGVLASKMVAWGAAVCAQAPKHKQAANSIGTRRIIKEAFTKYTTPCHRSCRVYAFGADFLTKGRKSCCKIHRSRRPSLGQVAIYWREKALLRRILAKAE
jgi:hypothetical protein